MCGIAGTFTFSGQTSATPESIGRMVAVMRHRGPDEAGIYLDDRVGLGHARLSIIDLSGGTQPIHNEDRSLWIVYNGEVFNYIELREELLQAGHRFYTDTDTEVILHLYEQYGAECVHRLNGQFAFAVWDPGRQELFLARDRVGIMPLFYTRTNEAFHFASEIKALFTNPQLSREIDRAGLAQVFTFWTTLPGKTVFAGVHELPPGHHMLVSPGQTRVRRYWDFPFCVPAEQLDWPVADICDHVRELLLDAIRLRLRADVPVGCYLSGGLDSSILATLVARNFNSTVRTFGIRFSEAAFDEGHYQQQMVSFLGTPHAELEADNELIGHALAEVVWHCEKPLLRMGPVPLFLLSGLVRDSGFKVVLTGEGADEVFGGYNIFREAKVRAFWARNPGSRFRGLLIGRLYPYIFTNPRMRALQQSFFATGLENSDDPLFSHRLRWDTTAKTALLLADAPALQQRCGADLAAFAGDLPEGFQHWDYLSKAQYVESKIFLSNYLLSSQGDRVAMAHSLELRVPYLDHRLIEFMGRVPAVLKIPGLNEKYLLKESFRATVPADIVARPKNPYRAPIAQSLLSPAVAAQCRDLLSDAALKRSNLFDTQRLRRFQKKIDSARNISETDNMAIVGVISAQMLHDQFVARAPAQGPVTLDSMHVVDCRHAAAQR